MDEQFPPPSRPDSGRVFRGAWTGVVLAAAGAALLFTGLRGCSEGPSIPVIPVVAPAPVSSEQVVTLPQATTFTSIPAAPTDQYPFAVTDGEVMHPLTPQIVYVAPGEKPIAVLPTTELGDPTWVPVVQSSPGWDQVLLPSRPDRATGWIYTDGTASSELMIRVSPYLIWIEVGARKLSVYDDGASLGTWTVAVGAPQTPTPTGRTFLLALLAPTDPTYSPLILPLGTHSNALSTYGGGPGTVGLHGWPNPSVFGEAVSNGCVRVPSTAMQLLSRIPLGTLVVITP